MNLGSHKKLAPLGKLVVIRHGHAPPRAADAQERAVERGVRRESRREIRRALKEDC
jgi:hypothetical protein